MFVDEEWRHNLKEGDKVDAIADDNINNIGSYSEAKIFLLDQENLKVVLEFINDEYGKKKTYNRDSREI